MSIFKKINDMLFYFTMGKKLCNEIYNDHMRCLKYGQDSMKSFRRSTKLMQNSIDNAIRLGEIAKSYPLTLSTADMLIQCRDVLNKTLDNVRTFNKLRISHYDCARQFYSMYRRQSWYWIIENKNKHSLNRKG